MCTSRCAWGSKQTMQSVVHSVPATSSCEQAARHRLRHVSYPSQTSQRSCMSPGGYQQRKPQQPLQQPSNNYITTSYCRSSSSGSSSCSLEQSNLFVLQQLVSPAQLQDMLYHHPLLLQQTEFSSWVRFLSSYGLSQQAISRLLLHCPEVFEPPSSIFSCGQTLLFFKGLGWRDADILGRIVPQYPSLLAKQLETDILPVVTYLCDDMGCSPADVRLLVWEFPRIFTRDYKRHIRKFQYLGLYGLPAPGTASSGSASRQDIKGDSSPQRQMDSLSRLLMAFH